VSAAQRGRHGLEVPDRQTVGPPAASSQPRLRLQNPVEDADPPSPGQLRHGVEPEMRWAHWQSLAPPRVIVHSMLLDFGADPAPGSGIFWKAQNPGEEGAAPIWNCKILLAEVK
jgi:hypothetical protein